MIGKHEGHLLTLLVEISNREGTGNEETHDGSETAGNCGRNKPCNPHGANTTAAKTIGETIDHTPQSFCHTTP